MGLVLELSPALMLRQLEREPGEDIDRAGVPRNADGTPSVAHEPMHVVSDSVFGRGRSASAAASDLPPFGGTGRSTWAFDFHSGDDDPVGMAIAPDNCTSSVNGRGDDWPKDPGDWQNYAFFAKDHRFV